MSETPESAVLSRVGPLDRTYALLDLTPRDTKVFKSIVGLLSGRTRDRWACVEGDQADVWIVSASSPVLASRRVEVSVPSIPMIRIDAAGSAPTPDGLTLPFRADDVRQQLDRASERVKAWKAFAAEGPRRLQLMRWPGSSLLVGDPEYVRLATIAGMRPITVEDLSTQSNCSLATCHAFAAVMHGNGVARWLLGPSAASEAKVAAHQDGQDMPGLLSRIRARLNLGSLEF